MSKGEDGLGGAQLAEAMEPDDVRSLQSLAGSGRRDDCGVP
jgi:hypothetical protein